MTAPSDGVSRPARMLSTVVLPQPEWPMMQVKSPRAIESQRFSNTVVVAPPGAGKRRVIPSMEMNLSAATISLLLSFGERHEPRGAGEDLVERHADDADDDDRRDHIGDRQVVPLIPDKIPDAGSADQHLGGDDHE